MLSYPAALFRALVVALTTGLAGGAYAADQMRVHVSPPLSIESAPYWLADELGYYKEEGIDYKSMPMATSVGVTATIAGELEATQILGLSLRGAVQGMDMKIVMVFNRSPTFSFAARQASTWAELKGKKIGATAITTSSTVMMREKLQAAGVDPAKDVTFFYLGAPSSIYEALNAGTIDGGYVVVPNEFDAVKRGMKLLPYAEGVRILVGGVAVRGKFAAENPDLLRRFLHATYRGLRTFHTDRAKTIPIMAKVMKIDVELATKVYDRWHSALSEDGHEDQAFMDAALNYEFGATIPQKARDAFDFSIVKSFKDK